MCCNRAASYNSRTPARSYTCTHKSAATQPAAPRRAGHTRHRAHAQHSGTPSGSTSQRGPKAHPGTQKPAKAKHFVFSKNVSCVASQVWLRRCLHAHARSRDCLTGPSVIQARRADHGRAGERLRSSREYFSASTGGTVARSVGVMYRIHLTFAHRAETERTAAVSYSNVAFWSIFGFGLCVPINPHPHHVPDCAEQRTMAGLLAERHVRKRTLPSHGHDDLDRRASLLLTPLVDLERGPKPRTATQERCRRTRSSRYDCRPRTDTPNRRARDCPAPRNRAPPPSTRRTGCCSL